MKRAVIAVTLVMVAGSCGGGPGRSGGFSPRSDDQLVLKIENKGGFVPVEVNLSAIPSLALYADGTVILPGPQIEIYPPPALPNLRVRKIERKKVEEVLAAAEEAGLTDGDKQYAKTNVMDASTAVFTVDNGEKVSVVEVYAMDLEGETGARGKISRFNQDVFRIIGDGEDEEYVPESFQIIVAKAQAQEQPDEIQASHQPWPLAAKPDEIGEPHEAFGNASRCAVTEGDETTKLIEALRSANTLTQWDHEGVSYRIYPRPLLPGEQGCV